MSGVVELVDLSKYFGENPAVDHIALRVESGEFFSLLGPSGCGKTTTLRLIAGFERPDSGAILIDGIDQAGTPPHKRPVNTVFQSYALFPHMNVADNVGFGLAYQDVPKSERKRRVAETLERVHLGGMESRKPTQLSGGQQQRVALARSLVLNPSVLLLDEPLGALDAKLRKALQVELKRLQEDLEITFIYVTHDQEEALTMSDRIAVMTEGTVEQMGTPAEIYEAPTSSYIADFLGISNLMYADAVGPGVIASSAAMSARPRIARRPIRPSTTPPSSRTKQVSQPVSSRRLHTACRRSSARQLGTSLRRWAPTRVSLPSAPSSGRPKLPQSALPAA